MKAIAPEFVNRFWQAARTSPESPRRCPTCDFQMKQVEVGSTMELEACLRCQLVWFDAAEFESAPPAAMATVAPKPELPTAERQAIALAKVRQIAEEARYTGPPVEQSWKSLPALFGFPVETGASPLRSWPWLTIALVVVVSSISVLAFQDFEPVVERFGFVPADPWRIGGLTFLSSFFLHGGILHLVGNMYFLLIFGDNVEDYLGRWRYGILILAATLTGDAIHLLFSATPLIPCIGASGGISGVIVFYALKFPQARLGFIIRFVWVRLPAWVALVLWLGLQFLGVYQQRMGLSNVASTAHLGGAAVGLGLWLWWRRLQA
jgi:membrane associated rhomboid family serine protease